MKTGLTIYVVIAISLYFFTVHVQKQVHETRIPTMPVVEDVPVYCNNIPETYKNLHSPPLTKHSTSLLQKSLQQYGLGSCGPRGFLGTFSSHIHLENEISKYYQMPSIYYSSYASVPESALVSAHAHYCYVLDNSSYEINRCLEAVKGEKINFGWLISDTTFEPKENSWMCFDSIFIEENEIGYNDVEKIIEFCEKNHIRTLMTDSAFPLSLNTNMEKYFEKVDLVVGSLEHSFGIPGGFCAGCRCLVENQRTAGLGYCFSAAAPPALAALAVQRLIKMDFQNLLANVAALKDNGWDTFGYYAIKEGKIIEPNEWLSCKETLELAESEIK